MQTVLRPLRHLTHHNLVRCSLCSILQPSCQISNPFYGILVRNTHHFTRAATHQRLPVILRGSITKMTLFSRHSGHTQRISPPPPLALGHSTYRGIFRDISRRHVNKELGTIIWISASHLAHNVIVDYLAEGHLFLRVLQMFFVAFSVEASMPLVQQSVAKVPHHRRRGVSAHEMPSARARNGIGRYGGTRANDRRARHRAPRHASRVSPASRI